MHTHVTIICKTHGKFQQTPHDHLKGNNCPDCAGKRHTMEWAIQRAKEVHSDKFEYLPFEFKNNKSMMNIVCPTHGLFHRTVQKHVNERNGCPKCCKTTKKSHDDFVKEANIIHDNIYEYISSYVNSKTKIKIRCKKHNFIFEQEPSLHLQGHGCPICGREIVESSKRLTLEEFIRRSNIAHNNKYDYSHSEYINGRTKTTITCPVHGPFEQTPEMHMAGQGCPKCSGRYNPTTDEFKSWFVEKFGDSFDLSEVDYLNNKTPIIVICPSGHRFERPPSYFTNSDYGCPICGYRSMGDSLMLTKEEFVNQAIQVHGALYSYKESDYKGMTVPVTIICKIHGRFSQRPQAHLGGSGCVECGRERIRLAQKDSKEDFILKARQVHGWKYDYSKVEYVNSVTPVCITCPTHGDFWQMPISHTQGSGCPLCNESRGEREIRKWLDEYGIEYIRQYRVDLPQALFSRNNLKIDFFVPSHNIFIEFNGEQHYKYMPFFHESEEDFAIQQDRDHRLRTYCKQNKIRLIEISYLDIDKIGIILDKKIGAKK